MPSELQLPSEEEDTWEYKTFTHNSANIVEKLSSVPLAAVIADKLLAAGIIGHTVREHAHIHAVGVIEMDRLRPMFTALEGKIKQNVQYYHNFRGILLSLGADADTALHYMPEKGN